MKNENCDRRSSCDDYKHNHCDGCGGNKPQCKWFDCIEKGTLKARRGDYVLYKVDFLLDNLAREVYIMEGARRMRGENQ